MENPEVGLTFNRGIDMTAFNKAWTFLKDSRQTKLGDFAPINRVALPEVVKSNDDLEKWAPLARVGAWGAKKLAPKLGQLGQKIGIKGGAATSGTTSMTDAVNFASDSNPIKPTGGSVATNLKPQGVKVNQSMVEGAANAVPTETSISSTTGGQEAGGGASPADPATSPSAAGAAGGNVFDPYFPPKKENLENYGMKVKVADSPSVPKKVDVTTSQPTTQQSTLKPDDPTLQAAEAESAARTPVTGKELADSEAKKRRTDQLQYGIMAQQMYAGHKGRKDTEMAAEQDRISRLSEDAKEKAGTGGSRVAVTA